VIADETLNSELAYMDEQFERFLRPPQAEFDPRDISFDDFSTPAALTTDPVVSVEVITYNQQELITRALDSILNQVTDFPYEVLVLDDCSTDETPAKIAEFQRRFPTIVRSIRTKHNVGANRNLRLGEILGRGEFIAVCEGDDYWHDPEKLQRQVTALRNNPTCVLVHTRTRNQFGTGPNSRLSTVGKRQLPEEPAFDLTKAILCFKYGVNTCCAMYRRDALEKAIATTSCLIDSEQFIQGDVPRYLALSRLGGFYFLNRETATYQVNHESLSHSACALKRFSISLSARMIRVWYARLFLNEPAFADELLRNALVKLRSSRHRQIAAWADDKMADLGMKVSIVEKAQLPFTRLQNLWRHFTR
jgi:glycosyltransferase involved in cell wall biosynthesis